MITQLGVPEDSLSLNIPTRSGQRKAVEIQGNKIDPALILARPQSAPALQGYLIAADNLLLGKPWSSRRVYVTSPAAGDGKTCASFNLAWALSLRTESVLLVELNFGRPEFRSVLGNLHLWNGIDCALRGSAKPADSVFSMGTHGLDVCAVREAAGQRDQHLERLDAFLDWCGERYDWLVLDCPPVFSREWQHWSRQNASPILMVVREGKTPEVTVRKAVDVLGSHLKGVLLNDCG
jgi:Mrp family chromosome partitioning ATPase